MLAGKPHTNRDRRRRSIGAGILTTMVMCAGWATPIATGAPTQAENRTLQAPTAQQGQDGQTQPAQPGPGQPSQPVNNPAAQEPAPTYVTDPNYLIGPNDRIRITVWNQANISGEYIVGGDGSFTFPHIGRVTASGLTLAKLESELKRLLQEGYYKNPQITAAVLDYRSKRVFLVGSLRQPGTYPLTGEMRLIEALARAGSTTTDAADHVFIIRSSAAEGPVLPGQDQSASVTKVDLRQLNEGQLAEGLTLRDGDTVFVPRASVVFVYGMVRTPGQFPVGQDTTVRQALALAGGASETGAVNRVKIVRVENGKEREIKAKLNDIVKPGDTVVVPERYF